MTTSTDAHRAAVDVVGDFLDAVAGANLERALALLAGDVTVHEPESLPYGGDHRGPDAFAAMLGQIAGAYRVRLDGHELHDAGDVVVAHVRCRMTSRTTGRELDVPIIELYRVRDGRILALDAFPKDTAAMLALHTAAG
ncbi:nuclear transport factor 2 family protein [Conexibacter sp. SYSU D00693]|uniref:nuclear transport factor 2 family protein n=1 Tax=Conexibacter sp. SYSU D00693 TaxID=2812560 RepID=UPI00196ACB9B|nr:nuclear transport factor 2 family protein [Conexibacter sp. SYSU D00693]